MGAISISDQDKRAATFQCEMKTLAFGEAHSSLFFPPLRGLEIAFFALANDRADGVCPAGCSSSGIAIAIASSTESAIAQRASKLAKSPRTIVLPPMEPYINDVSNEGEEGRGVSQI